MRKVRPNHFSHAMSRVLDLTRQHYGHFAPPASRSVSVAEVRRFYPFFPAAVAKVRHDFEWQGYRFPAGRRVLLDLHGINHDPRAWHMPGQFVPLRFAGWPENPFTFVPQGGGNAMTGHRCPGEWITVELMKRAAKWLAGRMAYRVPAQELAINMRRLPAVPKNGVAIVVTRPL
jgi:fatty-acid peroxygenase